MRVTNSMLSMSFLGDMNNNLKNMQKMQRQLDSGKKFSRPSDDPFAAARSMQLYGQIDANLQYSSNISTTINVLDATDTALGQVSDSMKRIRELMVSAGDGSYGEDELNAINNEIKEKTKEISQILNTSFDGKYIFAGKDGTMKPTEIDKNGNIQYNGAGKNIKEYKNGNIIIETAKGSAKTSVEIKIQKPDGTISNGRKLPSGEIEDIGSGEKFKDSDIKSVKNYSPMGEKLEAEISQGVVVKYGVSADEILNFKDTAGNVSNLSDLLSDVSKNLEAKGDRSKVIGEDLSKLDDAIKNLLTCRSKVGSMQNRMEGADNINKDQNINMQEILSKNENIDIVEKYMEYAVMQNVYMASLQTSAKIIQPTLMDYIR